MTLPTPEAIARIIDPKAWAYIDQHGVQNSLSVQMAAEGSLAKAEAITALFTAKPILIFTGEHGDD